MNLEYYIDNKWDWLDKKKPDEKMDFIRDLYDRISDKSFIAKLLIDVLEKRIEEYWLEEYYDNR